MSILPSPLSLLELLPEELRQKIFDQLPVYLRMRINNSSLRSILNPYNINIYVKPVKYISNPVAIRYMEIYRILYFVSIDKVKALEEPYLTSLTQLMNLCPSMSYYVQEYMMRLGGMVLEWDNLTRKEVIMSPSTILKHIDIHIRHVPAYGSIALVPHYDITLLFYDIRTGPLSAHDMRDLLLRLSYRARTMWPSVVWYVYAYLHTYIYGDSSTKSEYITPLTDYYKSLEPIHYCAHTLTANMFIHLIHELMHIVTTPTTNNFRLIIYCYRVLLKHYDMHTIYNIKAYPQIARNLLDLDYMRAMIRSQYPIHKQSMYVINQHSCVAQHELTADTTEGSSRNRSYCKQVLAADLLQVFAASHFAQFKLCDRVRYYRFYNTLVSSARQLLLPTI